MPVTAWRVGRVMKMIIRILPIYSICYYIIVNKIQRADKHRRERTMIKIVNRFYDVVDDEIKEVAECVGDYVYEFKYELISAESRYDRILVNFYIATDTLLVLEELVNVEDELSLLARMEADIEFDIVKYSVSNV